MDAQRGRVDASLLHQGRRRRGNRGPVLEGACSQEAKPGVGAERLASFALDLRKPAELDNVLRQRQTCVILAARVKDERRREGVCSQEEKPGIGDIAPGCLWRKSAAELRGAQRERHAGASGRFMATKDVGDADAGKLKVASSSGRRWRRRGRVRLSASSHRGREEEGKSTRAAGGRRQVRTEEPLDLARAVRRVRAPDLTWTRGCLCEQSVNF
jgi:hypothetical protein